MADSKQKSKYTLSEIDAALDKAKNAAPAGYGYGDEYEIFGGADFDVFLSGIKAKCAELEDRTSCQIVVVGGVAGLLEYGLSCGVPGTLYRHNPNEAYFYGYTTTGDCKVRFSIINGVFSGWEWENPPMRIDTEYRTIKRFRGKPVYTLYFYYGNLPNATRTDVEYGDASCRAISAIGLTNGNDVIPYENNAGSGVKVNAFNNIIRTETTIDRSGVSAHFTVEYFKTTDD